MTDSKTLATFRVQEANWAAFKEKARKAGSTASEILNNFVNAYLSDSLELPALNAEKVPAEQSAAIDNLDSRIDEKIAPIREELAELRAELGKSRQAA
jgi:hypothetical protein